jgi:TatD DNase family protein
VNLTDTHCHLYFESYQKDLPEVLDRARDAGLKRILVPAIDLESCREVLKLIDAHDFIYGAIGIHPNSAQTWQPGTLETLKSMADHPKVVAIGEIGLDYFRNHAPHNLQREVLISQLQLAGEHQLPVVLHVRNKSEEDRSCLEDMLTILENWLKGVSELYPDGSYRPGVLHSFSGNIEESNRAVRAGFFLGIPGFVTFKNSTTIQEVIKNTRITRLLVETDGPFLTPHPFRGKRNEPAHVRYIVDKISEVTEMPGEQVAEQTAENAANLFMWE